MVYTNVPQQNYKNKSSSSPSLQTPQTLLYNFFFIFSIFWIRYENLKTGVQFESHILKEIFWFNQVFFYKYFLGEHPAAMQRGCASTNLEINKSFYLLSFFLILNYLRILFGVQSSRVEIDFIKENLVYRWKTLFYNKIVNFIWKIIY